MCLNGRELENWKKKRPYKNCILFCGCLSNCGSVSAAVSFIAVFFSCHHHWSAIVAHKCDRHRACVRVSVCLLVCLRVCLCVCVCVCVSPFVSPLTDPQDGASHLRVSVLFCFLFSTVSFSLVGPNASDLMDFADPITSRRIMSSSTVIKEFFFASFSTTFLFIIRRGRFFFSKKRSRRKRFQRRLKSGNVADGWQQKKSSGINNPWIINDLLGTAAQCNHGSMNEEGKKSESKRSHSRTIYFRLCFSLVRFWWKKKRTKAKEKKNEPPKMARPITDDERVSSHSPAFDHRNLLFIISIASIRRQIAARINQKKIHSAAVLGSS